jgi:hypothetical protein
MQVSFTDSLILLMWRIGRAPNNANRWQVEFNSAFKRLKKMKQEQQNFMTECGLVTLALQKE